MKRFVITSRCEKISRIRIPNPYGAGGDIRLRGKHGFGIVEMDEESEEIICNFFMSSLFLQRFLCYNKLRIDIFRNVCVYPRMMRETEVMI